MEEGFYWVRKVANRDYRIHFIPKKGSVDFEKWVWWSVAVLANTTYPPDEDLFDSYSEAHAAALTRWFDMTHNAPEKLLKVVVDMGSLPDMGPA